jgi:hypothetical protein
MPLRLQQFLSIYSFDYSIRPQLFSRYVFRLPLPIPLTLLVNVGSSGRDEQGFKYFMQKAGTLYGFVCF